MADGMGTYDWAHMLRITLARPELLSETEGVCCQLHIVENLKFI
jgi:hypothetical protein